MQFSPAGCPTDGGGGGEKVKITFEYVGFDDVDVSDVGQPPKAVEIDKDGSLSATQLADPAAVDGFVFGGWRDKDGKPVTATTKFSDAATVLGLWSKVNDDGNVIGGDGEVITGEDGEPIKPVQPGEEIETGGEDPEPPEPPVGPTPGAPEKVALENGSSVIYKFELPAGTAWEDYEKITVEYQLGADALAVINEYGIRHARLMGNYKESDFETDDNGAKVLNLSSFNAPYIMQNYAPKLEDLTALGAAAGEWFTVTYDISGASAHSGFVPADNMPADSDTGPFYFGLGISAQSGADSGNKPLAERAIVQLIRNVTLVGYEGVADVVSSGSGFTAPAFVTYVDPVTFSWRGDPDADIVYPLAPPPLPPLPADAKVLGAMDWVNNATQMGWRTNGTDKEETNLSIEELQWATHLVLDLRKPPAGGLQITWQGDGDNWGWNQTAVLSGSGAPDADKGASLDGNTLMIELSKAFSNYDALKASTQAKFLVAYYSDNVADLGIRRAYLIIGPGTPEKVALENGSSAIYKFVLPAGAVWEDYEKITVDYQLGADALAVINEYGIRHARLMGNYKEADFDTDENGAKVLSLMSFNAPYIMHNYAPNAAALTALGAAADEWFTVTYDISGSSAHSGFSTDNMPADTDTGPFYFGLGISAQSGADSGNKPLAERAIVQLIRNVTLVGYEGVDNVVSYGSGFTAPAFVTYVDPITFSWRGAPDAAIVYPTVPTSDPFELGDFTSENNENQKGWATVGLDEGSLVGNIPIAKMKAAKNIVLELSAAPVGGLQVFWQGDGDNWGWNQTNGVLSDAGVPDADKGASLDGTTLTIEIAKAFNAYEGVAASTKVKFFLGYYNGGIAGLGITKATLTF